jgi:predicted alpha/beta-fold hydrolase
MEHRCRTQSTCGIHRADRALMPQSVARLQRAAFLPPVGLRNPHVQSTLLSLSAWRLPVLRQSRALRAVAEPVILDCGAGVRLGGFASLQPSAIAASAPWVMLLHGWLGDAQSSYVLSLGAVLYAQGYNVFRLNLRDHGDTEHLNSGLFHSCLLDEVVGAVRAVQQRYSIDDLSLAGFSLGGNFALRVAARAGMAGIKLRQVVAICPALNPHASDAALAAGPPLYRHYFLSKWKQVLKSKQRHFPDAYQFGTLLDTNSITELTDLLVQRHAGFSGVREYYDGYSLLGNTLRELRVPSRLLIAQDDPIVPAVDALHLPDNPHLHITSSDYGGHCGFIASWGGKRWVNQWALDSLNTVAPAITAPAGAIADS